jgi:hypothetical protein
MLTAVLISMLLLSAVAGTLLADLGRANPYNPFGIPEYVITEGFPDSETKPPTVLITSPTNGTYPLDTVFLNFNVSVGDSSTASYLRLTEITIEADWLPNKMSIGLDYNAYELTGIPEGTRIGYDMYECKLTGIPEGTHEIVVHAQEKGKYERVSGSGFDKVIYITNFLIDASSSITVTIDIKPPIISVLSIENKTYTTSDLQLNFTVSESLYNASYILDGNKNVAVSGNTTLLNLPYGEHNVTVFATDEAGNTGASETIYFTTEEPFPTVPVATVSLTSATVVVGLLVYFKKRKH